MEHQATAIRNLGQFCLLRRRVDARQLFVFAARFALSTFLCLSTLLSLPAFVCVPLGAQVRSQPRKFEVLTRNYDNQRTAANTSETILNTSNVNARQFGKLFLLPVDDQVYAGLLYAADVPIAGRKRNVLYVATVANTVYAFDADAPGTPLWRRNFNGAGRPTHHQEVGQACRIYNDFIGDIGIVGTPVIAPNRAMYFVTRTVEGGNTIQRLHAIDIATGAERPGSPKVIRAAVPGKGEDSIHGVVAFNALTENQRPALAYADGAVYVGWASFCDTRPYHGWMMSYDASTLAQIGVFNATPNRAMSGIWMSGAGPVFDRQGNLFVSTGNGGYDGATEFGESLIKLGKRDLRPLDFFAPSNFNSLNESDLDFGTQGPVMLPGTQRMIIGGKEGKVYLLDARNLGGEVAGDTQIRQVVQAIDMSVRPTRSHHLHNSVPTWRAPQGLNIYTWGENDFLRAFRFDAAADKFVVPSFASADILPPMGMPGGMMTISADGPKSGSGILWAAVPRAGDANQMTVPGALYAFDAENLRLLWNSSSAGDDPLNFAKGSPPIVANGKLYVASISGFVSVYGLKSGTKTGEPAAQNLALNRPATGTAPCDPTQTADKAFNGSSEAGPTDKWCSAATNPYLQVDLGRETTIGRVVIEHAGAGGDDLLLNTRNFNLEAGTDGEHFRRIATAWSNIQSITTHDFVPVTARYVRLNVVTPAQIDNQPANIYEMQVFAPAEVAPPAAPPATLREVARMPKRAADPPPAPSLAPPPDVSAPPADAEITASRMAMRVLNPGSGDEHPQPNDCARVSFTAWERNGALFSTSIGTAETVCLNTAMLGVSEALQHMTAGEKARLWVPADLTFRVGEHHAQHRPEDEEPVPHEDLTIDLQLISLMQAPPRPAAAPPPDAVRTITGLAFEVLKPGSGTAHPSPTSTVKIHFSGWTSNGRLFESTTMSNHPAVVPLAGAMAGWREALTHMTVGEKARFWIPASLAYGKEPANRFHPQGDLVYEIELIGIE